MVLTECDAGAFRYRVQLIFNRGLTKTYVLFFNPLSTHAKVHRNINIGHSLCKIADVKLLIQSFIYLSTICSLAQHMYCLLCTSRVQYNTV